MEDNKEKRTRRSKEQIEADDLLKATPAVHAPVKRKKVKKGVNVKSKEGFVPGNLNPNYLISPIARKECYVYAVKRVTFDERVRREDIGKEQLLKFRTEQVHSTAIWDKGTGEMTVNTVYQTLLSEYGIANVVVVNDPYEYI